MEIIIRRFCYMCERITQWRVTPNGKYWETHECTACGLHQEFKTT